MAERIILHIDMDYFFAQIEERENPHFKGKPLVVGADPKEGKGRGVVSTANYEARKYGIHSAMPITFAYRLCPTAVFLPVNSELYGKVSYQIMCIARRHSPLFEQTSLDEAYLDISLVNTYEAARSLAEQLKKEIFEKEGLTATCGIGPNKMIAKIACQLAKPNGLLEVPPERAENFLEPLDIQMIPNIGPKTAQKLKTALRLEKSTVKELKETSREELVKLLGVGGQDIFERVRGIDETPLSAEELIKSIGKEHTFEKDTREPQILFSTFEIILKEMGRELEEKNLSCGTLVVVCRFRGFETHTKSKTLPQPTRDFRTLKREATKLLLQLIVNNPKPIRLIGVRVKLSYVPEINFVAKH